MLPLFLRICLKLQAREGRASLFLQNTEASSEGRTIALPTPWCGVHPFEIQILLIQLTTGRCVQEYMLVWHPTM